MVIPDQLRQELGGFAESAKILEGPIFISRSGKCWDRVAIHKSLKKLCREAKVDEEKAVSYTHLDVYKRQEYYE